jgi:hypothetical protein
LEKVKSYVASRQKYLGVMFSKSQKSLKVLASTKRAEGKILIFGMKIKTKSSIAFLP